jgi:ABC-type dipeptide/oligopeptide/nickel transport system permease component
LEGSAAHARLCRPPSARHRPGAGMVAIFVSFVLRLMPADPAAIIAGDNATAAQIAAVRDKLGLSRPILSSS